MFGKSKKMSFLMVALALTVGMVCASVLISNLWTSPNVTVTTPPPGNQPLAISSPDFTSPGAVHIGDPFYLSVETVNPSESGAPGYTGVTFNIRIYDTSDGTIAPTDVTLWYNTGTVGSPIWTELTLAQGTGMLTATFGPPGGFPVGYGYDVTTQFKATFDTAGTYHAEVEAVTG